MDFYITKCKRKLWKMKIKTTSKDDAFLVKNSKHDLKKRSFALQSDLQHTTVRRQCLEVGQKAGKFLRR